MAKKVVKKRAPAKGASAKEAARPKANGAKAKAAVDRKVAAKSEVAGAAKVARKVAKIPPPVLGGADGRVLDRLWSTVLSRRDADPVLSHSARLLSRGTAKVAQKFGEEAVECLIEAVAGNRHALIGESADVLYHLMVLWVDAGLRPDEVWAELARREGISGIAEKAARPQLSAIKTSKIP
jgi:phosphoribosyl-ATP pyrophosphohydrolase